MTFCSWHVTSKLIKTSHQRMHFDRRTGQEFLYLPIDSVDGSIHLSVVSELTFLHQNVTVSSGDTKRPKPPSWYHDVRSFHSCI